MTDDIDARNRAHAWKAPWATPFFAPFLGLAATRVWMQCTFFGAYAQSDAGTLTIVNQLFYGLAMLIGALIALKHPATPGARRAVSFAGTFLMTVGSILILLGSSSSNMGILLAACILAGIGGALGGAMWIEAYIRLDLRRCILYAFLSLALGSFGGLVLSFAPVTTMLAAGMLMPALSLLCHQRAVRIDIGTPPEPKPVFDAEPISTALIIVGGLAAFGFALGVARGFPLGQPVQLDVPERMVHQLGVIAVSIFIIWWSLVKNRRLGFSFLWRIEITLVAFGTLALSLFPDDALPLAVAVINAADTLMLGIMWVTLQDVARHTSRDAYVIYGLAWAARVLARDAARVLLVFVASMGAAAYAASAIVGAMSFALALSMVMLLTSEIPRTRPLLTWDDEVPASPALSSRRKEDRNPAVGNALDASDGSLERTEAWLRARFGLSKREAQVAALIAMGRSKIYIAEHLFIADNTVRTHAKNAYAKLGVHSNQELIDLIEQQEARMR